MPEELLRILEASDRDIAEGRTSSHEEVMKYAKKCIEEGLRDIAEGRMISDEEMRKSLAKWL